MARYYNFILKKLPNSFAKSPPRILNRAIKFKSAPVKTGADILFLCRALRSLGEAVEMSGHYCPSTTLGMVSEVEPACPEPRRRELEEYLRKLPGLLNRQITAVP